jgi:hypothetical protein
VKLITMVRLNFPPEKNPIRLFRTSAEVVMPVRFRIIFFPPDIQKVRIFKSDERLLDNKQLGVPAVKFD